MKVSNTICELKHHISTMVLCGSYMFRFSVSKDTNEIIYMIKGGSREGSNTFIVNPTYQGIKKVC
jgi:hypothetical protein